MSQKIRKERITKAEFHARGGAENPSLFRLQSRGGAWRYYVRIEPETLLYGTTTGRTKSRGPLMHNLPRTKKD